MPNPIYPGAIWVGGAAAGYAKGRTSMQTVVCHYTVGRNSTGIGLNGYFHWLVSRDGTVQQFCEADALAWHAGEWNGTGPGIEVEYLDEPSIFTDEARTATGGLVSWLHWEWGVPLDYYDGPRIGMPYAGFISHRSLIQSAMHDDYWPREDWDAMLAPPAPPPPPLGGKEMIVGYQSGNVGFFALIDGVKVGPLNPDDYVRIVSTAGAVNLGVMTDGFDTVVHADDRTVRLV